MLRGVLIGVFFISEIEGLNFKLPKKKNFSVPRDPELYECYRQADLLLPDGVGMVKAAVYGGGVNLRSGSRRQVKVPGDCGRF